MAEKIMFSTIPYLQGEMLKVTPLAKFDDSHFSQRELRILKQLVEEFCDTLADDMIEKTHLKYLPWYKVYHEEGKKQGLIPYAYAVSDHEVEKMESVIIENQEMRANYL